MNEHIKYTHLACAMQSLHGVFVMWTISFQTIILYSQFKSTDLKKKRKKNAICDKRLMAESVLFDFNPLASFHDQQKAKALSINT